MKTAAIVVTFNRENQLIDCLNAILEQSLLPSHLIIVDNNSALQTPKKLVEEGFISQMPKESSIDKIYTSTVFSKIDKTNSILVSYIRKHKNDGGAGGFYSGMKYGNELDMEYLWMMDDDGVPEENQLQNLIKGSIKNELYYSNALVIDINNNKELAFSLGDYDSAFEASQHEVISNLMNPFNGTLVNRKVIEKIGFIKREMFIWGDEIEYTNRVRKNGFKIGTVTTAIHYHPSMRGKFNKVIPFFSSAQIVIKPPHFSHYYYRNLGYNQSQYGNNKTSKVLYWIYVIYFLTRFKFKELSKFTTFYKDGMLNSFDRK